MRKSRLLPETGVLTITLLESNHKNTNLVIEKIIHKAGISALLAAAFLLGSCADDHDPDGGFSENGGMAEVTFSLSSRYNGAQTRADGTPTNPVSDNEKIKDWFLVFTDKNNNVCKILERKEAVSGVTDPVEEETFTCTLPTGTYSVYAFANITRGQLTAATAVGTTPGLTFAVDNTLTLQTMQNALWHGLNNTDGKKTTPAESITQLGTVYDANVSAVSTDNLNLWNIDSAIGAIPMTGYLGNIKVENTIEEKFSIEVVRMVAKMELKFQNPGDKAVTVNGIAFSPVTVSPVSLFPMGTSGISYDHLGEGAFTPVTNNLESARLMYTFTTPLTIPAATTVDEVLTSGENSCTFYIKESLSHDNGGFTVWLNVTYENGVTEFMQNNPTVDVKGYINRNDWIRIPITLSEYDVMAEAIFYPPIGGYPALTTGTDPDGSQQFTFGTQGKFAIMPYVTDKLKGEKVNSNRYRVEVSEIRYKAKGAGAAGWKNVDWATASQIYANGAAVGADKGIFTTMPVAVELTPFALPFEILGELNTEQGIARVTLKVSVYADEYAAGATPKHVYTRQLYIIRDNNPSTP